MFFSEEDYIVSVRIIKNFFKDESDEIIRNKANKILSIANSIGADFSEDTLTKIAVSYYEINK